MVKHQEVPDNEANFEGVEEGEDDSDLGYILPPRLVEPSKTTWRIFSGRGVIPPNYGKITQKLTPTRQRRPKMDGFFLPKVTVFFSETLISEEQ